MWSRSSFVEVDVVEVEVVDAAGTVLGEVWAPASRGKDPSTTTARIAPTRAPRGPCLMGARGPTRRGIAGSVTAFPAPAYFFRVGDP